MYSIHQKVNQQLELQSHYSWKVITIELSLAGILRMKMAGWSPLLILMSYYHVGIINSDLKPTYTSSKKAMLPSILLLKLRFMPTVASIIIFLFC